MIHGILVILKIMGMLFLILFLLLFVMLLLVLLVPVRYRVKASVLEKRPDVDVRVTWLLHLISVSVSYHPGETPYRLIIRIAGFRLGGRKKKDRTDFPAEDSTELFPEAGPETEVRDFGQAQEDTDQAAEITESEGFRDVKEASQEDLYGRETDQELWEAADAGSEKKSGFTERIRQMAGKVQNGLLRIPEAVRKLQDGVEALTEKKDRLIAFWEDSDNQKMFRLLRRQAGGVVGHILPGKFRLYLRFGFPDPCLTGQILGYVSMFYAYYYRTVELVPEFQTDTLILEGNLYAKGRVRAASLLCRGIRLLLDKGCRRMIRKALKK